MSTAPVFITQDPLADIDSMIAYYESLAGVTLAPAAAERLILNTNAYHYSRLKAAIQDAAQQNLVDFAQAPALDYLGVFFGVVRLAPAGATAAITFTLSGSPSPLTIPAGTRIATADGLVIFATTAAVTVIAAALSATATAECLTLGSAGNDYAIGTVTDILDPIPYLTAATNTAITAGGSDAETDDQLRERIKLAPGSFSVAGSRQAYRFWARSASALICDVAVPDTLGDGVVNIYPLLTDGSSTSAGILTAVRNACSAETVRPLSDTVNAIAPTRTTFNLTAVVTPYIGHTVTVTEVTDAIEAFITAKRQTLGNDIVDTQITNVIHNTAPGQIFDVSLTAWTDIVIAPTEFAVLNTLTVTFNAAVLG
jgi:phage-related baseplate assembly protein